MNNLQSLQELQPQIIEWARERNILFPENAPKQRLKLIEECGELASAILKNDVELQKDAIGDIFVVLVILGKQVKESLSFKSKIYTVLDNEFMYISKLIWHSDKFLEVSISCTCLKLLSKKLNLDLTECANIAWNEIKNRTGKTVNGTFIKDEIHRDGGVTI